jgi:hypothetical protein
MDAVTNVFISPHIQFATAASKACVARRLLFAWTAPNGEKVLSTIRLRRKIVSVVLILLRGLDLTYLRYYPCCCLCVPYPDNHSGAKYTHMSLHSFLSQAKCINREPVFSPSRRAEIARV